MTIVEMPVASRVLSPIGGFLVALGVFIPYGELDGDNFSVLDFDQVDFTLGFAIEPLAVAAAAGALAFLPSDAPRLIAAALIALGAQTAFLYLGLVIFALNVEYALRTGAIVGLVGALLIFGAGVFGLRAPEPTGPQATTPESSSLPPSGWYPDPTGEADERSWDGESWTEATR